MTRPSLKSDERQPSVAARHLLARSARPAVRFLSPSSLLPAVPRSRPAGLTSLTLAAGLWLAFSLAGCGGHEDHSNAVPEGAPIPVSVHYASVSRQPALTAAAGVLRSAREVAVSGKVMGRVVEIRKRAGDPVRRGETLIVIDSGDIRGQLSSAEGALAQARAAATLAEANFQRFEQLHQRGSASSLELDQARYQRDAALGAVAQAQGAVATAGSYGSYAEIPAPMSGRVVQTLCEIGDMAAPGHPLLRLEDPQELQLHVSLDAGRAAAASPGAKVSIEVPGTPGGRHEGTVAEVVPAADPATQTVLVKIDVAPGSGLQAGVFGRAFFTTGEREGLFVPSTTVRRRGGLTGVMVAERGRAAFRLVTLASPPADRSGAALAGADPLAGPGRLAGSGAGGGLIEVLSGVAPGDTLLVDPTGVLAIGAPIQVRS